ncbi:MAG: DUF3048 domain-containing protein [Actinomycetota bacterium]|jgi:hypothetical protein|nr:DUF3048 domain-containing protein [Actinomycetota bacterium]
MKQATLVIGVAGLICIACAADLRDAHDTVNAETPPTKLAAEATTTVQPDQSNDESGKTSEPSASGTTSTTTPQQKPVSDQEREFLAPFRGTPIDSTELYSPPLALKIDNAPTALPQQGLQDADIVFEELVEGGLTRFLAIFHSQIPASVGPIRSGRSTDIPLLMPFDGALFGWSGSNWAFRKLLDTVAITDVGLYRNPSHYWRQTERISPSNLWVRASQLFNKEAHDPHSSEPLWPYELPEETTSGPSREIKGVKVDWGSTKVEHLWDAARSGWARSQNDDPHVVLDLKGEQHELAPENLIIQFTKYVLTNEEDVNGARIPLGLVSEGSGTALILKDGGLIEGRWIKANVTVHTDFFDNQGRLIAMSPGSTWVLLAPRDSVEILEIDD